MCWLIVSLEMKTGWKKKVTEKHFSPLSTQENINWYCQTAIKKQESSVTFPCSLWSVGITFQAVDVGSCEHFGSRTVGFIIPKWIPGLTALCLLKCIQQTKDVPRIQHQGMVYDNNHRHLIIKANVYSLLWASQFTHINWFHPHNNHIRCFHFTFTDEEIEAQRDKVIW